jgi:hypothetical protein
MGSSGVEQGCASRVNAIDVERAGIDSGNDGWQRVATAVRGNSEYMVVTTQARP